MRIPNQILPIVPFLLRNRPYRGRPGPAHQRAVGAKLPCRGRIPELAFFRLQ